MENFYVCIVYRKNYLKKAEKTRKKWICVHVDRSMWKMRIGFMENHVEK